VSTLYSIINWAEVLMASRTIYVWLEPQTIDVCQQSEIVWVASGEFGRTPIRCEAASEIAAIRRWVKIARTSDDPAFDEGDLAESVIAKSVEA
jgi:hypothetical protein